MVPAREPIPGQPPRKQAAQSQQSDEHKGALIFRGSQENGSLVHLEIKFAHQIKEWRKIMGVCVCVFG